MTRKESIEKLYSTIIGKDIDQRRIKFLASRSLDLYLIQIGLWQSKEFNNKFNSINPNDNLQLNNCVPIYIINLERRIDRKEAIESKLNNLGIANYEIIKAIDGQQLPDDLSGMYDDTKAKQIHRTMLKSEIACALSHIEIAKKIVANDLPYAVVLEDDAELTIQFKNLLSNFDVNSNYGFDFLILGSFSSNHYYNGKVKSITAPTILNEKDSIIYLDESKYLIGNISIHNPSYPSVELDFVHGVHAYIISNSGAKKMLELNYPVCVEADNIWNYFPNQCVTEFTNPILAYRSTSNSDINKERMELTTNLDNFSNSFITRINHPDFGT